MSLGSWEGSFNIHTLAHADSFLVEPHVLDDVESLLYLIEFLCKANLPWGWPVVPEEMSFKDLLEEKKSWFPAKRPLREFLAYARDRW